MVKILKSIKNFLFPKQKEKVIYPLEEELVRKDAKIRALAQEVQSVKGQYAKVASEKKALAEKKKLKDKEKEIIESLNEKDYEIRKKRFGNTVSFRKLFKLLDNKKYKNKIDVCDKDDTIVFGKFGDIVELEGNYIGITDTERNLMIYGKNLSQIIYKPDSLGSQIKRKRILLPKNKDGEHIVDIEEEEMPEIIYDTNSRKFSNSKELIKPIKEMIMFREKEIQKLRVYLERVENSNIELKRKNEDIMRSLRHAKNEVDSKQTELSQMLEKSMQFERKVGDFQTQIIKLTEMKSLNEQLMSKYEYVIKELIDKLEQLGKTPSELAEEKTKDMVEWAKEMIPENLTINQQEKSEKRTPVSGEKI